MNAFDEAPLLRFLIFLIAGILFAIYFPVANLSLLIAICMFLLAVLLFQQYTRQTKYAHKNRWITGLTAFSFSFLVGYIITLLNTESRYPNHFRNIKNVSACTGYLQQPINEKEKSYKSILKIDAVLQDGKWISTNGSCLVYFAKDSLASTLRYGDQILFNSNPSELRPPRNPLQFDYKKWLANNNIYDAVYIPQNQWQLLEHHRGVWLLDFSFSLREKLLKLFKQNRIGGQDYAVLSALTLGDENEIDQETIRAFAASGTLHILSVSGMHVGIIFLAMNFLLGFMDRKKATRILKIILIILFLWFYALLTGLSSPVIRSAAMLSFIVLGKGTDRFATLFNILVVSAFFLLCWNPFWITQVGFQLSYLAVAGIIFFYPKIYELYKASNYLMEKTWSLVAVSLAAQLVTLPLCLLYFHQFPTYFLLSNLIIIPLSTAIIYGGIALLMFGKWLVISKFLGIVVGFLLHSLNTIVFGIERLPYSQIHGISISIIESILLYLLISFIFFGTAKKHSYNLIAVLSILCILTSFQISKQINKTEQQRLVVYDLPKKSVINIIDGGENIIIADSAIISNRNLMNFNIYNYWWACGLNEGDVIIPNDSFSRGGLSVYHSNFLLFNNLRIIKIDKSSGSLFNSNASLEADLVILSGNVKGKLKNILQYLKVKELIIDSSNSLYKAEMWMEEARELNLQCYSVPHQGAFVMDLRKDLPLFHLLK